MSLRLSAELLGHIDAWAAARQLTRTDAVGELVRLGLLTELAQRRVNEAVDRGSAVIAEHFFGVTALGEPLPARKPYQKGAKR